jgi:glycosyltransferase involved in cell wall biosynthesis
MSQFYPALQARGWDLTVSPFFDSSYEASQKRLNLQLARNVLSSYSRRLSALRACSNFNLVWLQIEALPRVPAFVESAAIPKKTKYVLDIDDAWFFAYEQSPSRLKKFVYADKISSLMRHAAAVIAGNEFLAGYARSSGQENVHVVPTVPSLHDYEPKRWGCTAPGTTPTIGWIGSPSTTRHLLTIREVIEELSREQGVRFLAIGADKRLLQDLPIEVRPWSAETESRDLAEFDIGIMPLTNDPWERGKCGFKIIQYMGAGLPVVASPVGFNRDLVGNYDIGFLPTSKSDWKMSLSGLTQDRNLCARLGVAGRKAFEQYFCLERHISRVVGLFETLATTDDASNG